MENRDLYFGVPAALLALTLSQGCAHKTFESTAKTTSVHCEYRPGSSGTLILGSTLLLADRAVEGGGLTVLPSGKIGEIGEFSELIALLPEASWLDCRGDTVLSPGWVNVHEHEAFSYAFPAPSLEPVYSHREEWIFGRNGMLALPIPPDRNYDPSDPTSLALLSWVELRHLFAGATTLGGPGAMPGLAKNIGHQSESVNVDGYTFEADLDIFPFSLESGEKFSRWCNQSGEALPKLRLDSPQDFAYAPHIGEGRKSDCTASAEIDAFLAYVAERRDSGRRFSAVHAIAASPENLEQFSELDVTLVWSPRSNLSLYGETIDIQEANRRGVRLALATDWSPSGSFSMLAEFECAQTAAQQQGTTLNGHQLWSMATRNAAYAAGIEDAVGELREGLSGDLVLLRRRDELDPYASAVNAAVDDVLMVWVDGNPIVADPDIARRMNIYSDCSASVTSNKVICADFNRLGILWDDIVALTADAVPINGDVSRQSSCNIAHGSN